MNERYLIKVQETLARALDPETLMVLARNSGFCERMRSVAPHEVAVALLAAMGTRSTETIADVVRVFNTLTKHCMAYKKRLLLGDRGYQGIDFCREVDAHGGHVLIRHQKKIDTLVVNAFINGKHVPKLSGCRLQDIVGKRKRTTIDVDGQWKGIAGHHRPDTKLRAVFLWNESRQDYLALVTNLDRERFPPEMLMQIYRLRWQVELLFKEWKSYCNLHKFSTTKAPIAKGLIWAALAASILKRFMAKAHPVRLRARRNLHSQDHYDRRASPLWLAAGRTRCQQRPRAPAPTVAASRQSGAKSSPQTRPKNRAPLARNRARSGMSH